MFVCGDTLHLTANQAWFRTHLSEKLWRKLWAERLWDCRNKYRMGMRTGKSQSTSHFVYL